MVHVTAIGELLIDFTPVQEGEPPTYTKHVGGAPANVLAVLSKLGKQTAFIGKVGEDYFGTYLKEALEEYHINTDQLVSTKDAPTTITFVHLDKTGDRSFTFYRSPGADALLSINDIDKEAVSETEVFHFGSISLTNEDCAEATYEAVKIAKQSGALISFDPNVRKDLWDDLVQAKGRVEHALIYADIVKFSEEEITFLTGETDVARGANEIRAKFNIPYIFVTLGAQGCYYMWGKHEGFVPTFIVDVKDTTGAGDAFMGSVLYGVLEQDELAEVHQQEVEKMLRFANAVAALTTTKYGAFASFPTSDEVVHLLGK